MSDHCRTGHGEEARTHLMGLYGAGIDNAEMSEQGAIHKSKKENTAPQGEMYLFEFGRALADCRRDRRGI